MTEVERVATLVRNASRVLVLTGAGMSADSGLPTYRGVGGLYEDADTPDGLSIEEVLSGQMLRRDPALCWRYIAQIEQACRGAEAHEGHRALAELEGHLDVVIVTQNVDGFHRDAGSSKVLEIHGTLRSLRCTICGDSRSLRSYEHLEIPPSCSACGGLVRPDVVLFGEALPSEVLYEWETQMGLGFDLVMSIGTSSLFPYIVQPVVAARQRGVPTVEINPGQSTISRMVDVHWQQRASVALSQLIVRLA